MTNNKARVAAQTASIGNKDMMTLMPSPSAESSSQTQEGVSSQNINIGNNDQLNTTGDTSDMILPDPLLVRNAMDRGESMDDEAFNASLDVLLTDPSYDNSNDMSSLTQQGIILPQPTPVVTAMETLINGGINVSDPLLNSSATEVGGGGTKRKAPPTRLLSDMSSITNSSGSSEIPNLSSSAPLHQQKSRGGSALVQQQSQAAATTAPNLNYSARSIIQLPPGMSFANQQPISVSTTACPGPTQKGVGNTNTTLSKGMSNILYSSSSGVGGGVGVGGAQQQAGALGNTAGVQQQQAIQVTSLTIPPHNSSTTAASGISSSMADLMSQIPLQTTQPTQVQGQSSSQGQTQLQIPGVSTNRWDALMANAATSAVQQPSSASALQQAAAVAAVYPPAAALPSAVPSSLPAMGQRRPSLPKALSLSNNMQRKRPYQGGNGLAVSEDESERKKRRNERNMREQERSHKISERISELKTVLSEAGVHFKPDRYSTLVSVVSYIKALQQRSASLDEEHRKLLDTIAGADKLVKANGGGSLIPGLSGAATATAAAIASKAGNNNPILPLSAKGIIPATAITTLTTVQTHEKDANATSSVASSLSNNEEEYLMFVKGIDYKSIFTKCGVALAIASVDGRFVDCNEEFLYVTNYTRMELLGDSPRRTSVLPHPQDDNTSPPSSGLKPGGQKQQGQAVTVSTTASTDKSSPLLAAATKKTPDVPASNSTCSHDSTSSPPPTTRNTDRPPKEIHMRKQHLSLFNLLGGKDMEAVYSAMSRMLRAPEHYSRSTVDESGGTSSSSDSFVKSDLTRSGAEESSSGNEVSDKREAAISRYTVDHWSGQVHTRRKNHMLQLNISLVRTAAGRPKFFNVSLSEVEKTPKEVTG